MATATKHPNAQDAANSSVRVEIFDQGYNLRGTDPEYILKLAAYVDSKMRAVAEQTHTVDSARHGTRSEEHTSELQSQFHLVWRLLPGKNKGRPDHGPGP